MLTMIDDGKTLEGRTIERARTPSFSNPCSTSGQNTAG
jgi:hypothetical protein